MARPALRQRGAAFCASELAAHSAMVALVASAAAAMANFFLEGVMGFLSNILGIGAVIPAFRRTIMRPGPDANRTDCPLKAANWLVFWG